MYEYIKGIIVEATPTYVVVENNGIGYNISISLNTYTEIRDNKEVMLYLHFLVREDANLLYGFHTNNEKILFRKLISVSGIGPNTAMVMLGYMSVEEIISAIQTENINAIKQVKGIGIKTAQRVIIDLKDKVGFMEIENTDKYIISNKSNEIREEAIAALSMLGFAKSQSTKVVDKIIAKENIDTVETLIKYALKQL